MASGSGLSPGVYADYALKGFDSYTSRGHTARYLVVRASGGDTPEQILALTGVPKIGAAGISGTKVIRRQAEADPDQPRVWRVEVEYSLTFTTTSFPPNAYLDARFRYRPEPYEEVAYKAWSSGASGATGDTDILNSAHDPFDPPLMAKKTLLIISCTKYRTLMDMGDIITYVGTTNADAVKLDRADYGPRTLLLRTLFPDPSYNEYGRVTSYLVQAEVAYKPEGWTASVPDMGYRAYFLSGMAGGFRPVRLSDLVYSGQASTVKVMDPRFDRPVDRPVKLLSGFLNPDQTAAPAYLEFCTVRPLSWAGLVNKYLS